MTKTPARNQTKNPRPNEGWRDKGRVPQLVLASSSPRRGRLLSAAGYRFETVNPGVPEKVERHLSPGEVTARNAVAKVLAVAPRYRNRVVLGADTVVVLEDEIIGKPVDLADATRTLKRLSGQTHHVYSSVFITHLAVGGARLVGEVSRVQFRKLSDSDIRDYLRKVNVLDKAGAYAAQGHGRKVIARLDGSYSNVVGLPMERTIATLKRFGIQPSQRPTPSPAARRQGPAPARGRGAKPNRGTKR